MYSLQQWNSTGELVINNQNRINDCPLKVFLSFLSYYTS
jgi:hypothetical protein